MMNEDYAGGSYMSNGELEAQIEKLRERIEKLEEENERLIALHRERWVNGD